MRLPSGTCRGFLWKRTCPELAFENGNQVIDLKVNPEYVQSAIGNSVFQAKQFMMCDLTGVCKPQKMRCSILL